MAKREWTPEQKKAFGEKMKAARQNKQPKTETVQQPIIEEKETTEYEPSVSDLMKQIQELKDSQFQLLNSMIAQNQGNNGPSVQNGRLTGTTDKYATDPNLYPDQTEQLKNEGKLQRFAFKLNYELEYNVTLTEYTTIDNVRTREPKFELKLIRVMIDEETGQDTGKRYVICNLIFFEDPETAMLLARQEGLEVSENEVEFLNAMRYLRMRDWIFECFYPAGPKPQSQTRDIVVDNRLVKVYSKSNESGNAITKTDWDKIADTKL